MQFSNIPPKVPLPFANSGTKNTIPVPSQEGITPGAASLTTGFPPLTFTPVVSGGVPPFGADFNGILNLITAIQQWQSAGGFFTYDSAFATEIGGYPLGAVLLKATGIGLWQSTVDSNMSDPDTGGSNWLSFNPTAVTTTYTANYLVVAGGGGGAPSVGNVIGGGGGAGGLISSSIALTQGATYTFVIGAGGGSGVSGGNTSFTGIAVAIGGGYGGNPGGAGGSGGGSVGAGTSGQGNNGGAQFGAGGGGGGGAGAIGGNAGSGGGGNGGVGLPISLTGFTTYYAGGGGGGGSGFSGQPGGGTGGNGGGGNGAGGYGAPGNGTANTGGGGGAGGWNGVDTPGGNGGSGIVIVSVPTIHYSGITTGSPTVSTFGGNTIMVFTSSGSYTA